MKGINPFYTGPGPAVRAGRPRITFGRAELIHLAVAVAILGLAFAYVVGDVTLTEGFPDTVALVGSYIAVLSGFVLHELAHKILAQRRGHWAEFRAQFGGLAISWFIAALAGILFAAPGAVHILGRVTPRENGTISLAGPATNFLIAAPLIPVLPVVDVTAPLGRGIHIVAFVNALLAVFNLLPLANLDGRKVWYWNRAVFGVSMALAVAAFVAVLLLGGGFPSPGP